MALKGTITVAYRFLPCDFEISLCFKYKFNDFFIITNTNDISLILVSL